MSTLHPKKVLDPRSDYSTDGSALPVFGEKTCKKYQAPKVDFPQDKAMAYRLNRTLAVRRG
jgi:hypothetical protein